MSAGPAFAACAQGSCRRTLQPSHTGTFCFQRRQDRRLVHDLALDEWRHRAWLRRHDKQMGMRPEPLLEAFFVVIGGYSSLVHRPFSPPFVGRLERDNGDEYDRMADEVGSDPYTVNQCRMCARCCAMVVIERRHERELLQLIRHHLAPSMTSIFQWPLRRPMEGKSRAAASLPDLKLPTLRFQPHLALS